MIPMFMQTFPEIVLLRPKFGTESMESQDHRMKSVRDWWVEQQLFTGEY